MAAYSLVVAAASAAFALPGGIVSDKVGRLPVLAVCWLLGVRHRTSVAMLLHASALLSLVIGQAVSSVGFAFVSSFPIVLAIGLGFGATAGVSSGPFFALVADIAPNPVRNSLLKKPFPIPSPYDQTWWGAGSSLEGHEHLHVGVHDRAADRAICLRRRHKLVQRQLRVRTPFGLLVASLAAEFALVQAGLSMYLAHGGRDERSGDGARLLRAVHLGPSAGKTRGR